VLGLFAAIPGMCFAPSSIRPNIDICMVRRCHIETSVDEDGWHSALVEAPMIQPM